ncbi:MAG: hypothetical protein PHY83_03800 [Bacilli bacterium]|jgi:hypothetical protein|nr:hypothetical protein [Bacilli bacterium]
MRKIISKFITVFLLIGSFVVLMITNIALPDKEFSYSERRKLAQIPQLEISEIANGDFFEDLEDYFLDQFAFRDFFRKIDSFMRLRFLQQKEVKGIYIIDDSLYKIEYPLNEKSVQNIAQKIEQISQEYSQILDIYYAVIPDKNYFGAQVDKYLSLDYQKMLVCMQEKINSAEYIDLFPHLKKEDYYRSDIHWRQDKIIDVVNKISTAMGTDYRVHIDNYTVNKLSPFYGTYYGQSPYRIEADELIYLTNEIIDQAQVYNFYTSQYINVYNEENLNNVDGYDVYLEGAVPLLTIENVTSESEKELYLFRDSFGSSIAPLFIEEYRKIHLIDLRYVSFENVKEYIDFKAGNIILFLYSTTIINNSLTLK